MFRGSASSIEGIMAPQTLDGTHIRRWGIAALDFTDQVICCELTPPVEVDPH